MEFPRVGLPKNWESMSVLYVAIWETHTGKNAVYGPSRRNRSIRRKLSTREFGIIHLFEAKRILPPLACIATGPGCTSRTPTFTSSTIELFGPLSGRKSQTQTIRLLG